MAHLRVRPAWRGPACPSHHAGPGRCLVFPVHGARLAVRPACFRHRRASQRSEEHTSELQSLMRISYAVFCLKKKNTKSKITTTKTKPSLTKTHATLTIIKQQ